MKDLESLRSLFPILNREEITPLVYLDSAATSLKPKSVIDISTDYYSLYSGTVHRAIYELSTFATKAYEETRSKVQLFLNASSSEEIIFTKGTTDSINLVASSFGNFFLNPGDVVLISQMEHHSNIVPWQMICKEKKALLKIIPIHANTELDLEAYKLLLNENNVKIVALTHVANSTGTENPIKEIIRLAHEKGAKVLIDGAQSAAHIAIDVQDLDVDFFAFSSHKLYGPTGIGILFGKKELLNSMPPRDGGGDMIETVTFEKTTYRPSPLRFEAGTPNICGVLGLGAAIDLLQKITLKKIHLHEQTLLDYATKKMQEIPNLRILGEAKNKSALISFSIDGIHPLDLGTLLDLKGIAMRTGHLCAQPMMQFFGVPSACRISFGIYNTKQEIDFFILSLLNAITLLKTC